MTNARQKGKRVELDIVHWFKDNGILSAQRSQQFCGANDSADVQAKIELPSFHIESKGTKDKKLNRSTLRAWFNQLAKDCGPLLPVLFHKANNCDIIGLIPTMTAVTLGIEALVIRPVSGDSFTPIEHIEEQNLLSRVSKKLWANSQMLPMVVAFEIQPDEFFLAMNANLLLTEMKKYEENVRLAKAVA